MPSLLALVLATLVLQLPGTLQRDGPPDLRGRVAAAGPGPVGGANLTSPGLLWTHGDDGAGWFGATVSLGDRGSQVFAEVSGAAKQALLLSAYDRDPAVAVWSDPVPAQFVDPRVVSSETSDVHVALHQEDLNNSSQTRRVVLRKYTSRSPTPDWTYSFAPFAKGQAGVDISADGRTIAAAIWEPVAMQVEVAVFDADSGIPLSYTTFPIGSVAWVNGFDLSADGSTLYFGVGFLQCYVVDVATMSPMLAQATGLYLYSGGISGDGSVLAFGGEDKLRIWERVGGSYVETITVTKPNHDGCKQLAVSEDGSTVAAAWYRSTYLKETRIEAIDVPTKALLMVDVIPDPGPFLDRPSSMACAADGAWFVVGSWGSQAGPSEQVRVYARNQSDPVLTFGTAGSVYSVDMTRDGRRVVAGSKVGHQSQALVGGQIDLIDLGWRDLTLRGAPRVGTTSRVEYHGVPGSEALLLASVDLLATPVYYTGIGGLVLPLASIRALPLGAVPAGGVLQVPLALPDDPALVGAVQHFQVLDTTGRSLSTHWFKRTVLP